MMVRRLKIQKQIDRERLLDITAQQIHQFFQLEEILNTAVKETQTLLEAERVLVYQFEPDWSGKVIAESVIHQDLSLKGKVIKDTCFEENWLAYYRQGKIKAIEDIGDAGLSECHVDFLSKQQVKASLIVPIAYREHEPCRKVENKDNGKIKVIDFLNQNRLWGLLIAHQCSSTRQWQQLEIDSLKRLTTLIAIAIQQSNLCRQAQKEVAGRKLAEEQLHEVNEELEFKVQERTARLQQEIAQRTQVEESLKESRHLIERITQSTPVSIYIFDLQEKKNIYANREIGTILGYQSEEIQKMGSQLLEKIMHPEDFVRYGEHQRKYKVLKDGEIIEFEYRVKRADGNWCWLVSRDTVFARNASGKPKQILGTAEDITERKHAEEKWQQLNGQLNAKVKELEERQREMNLLSDAINFLQACLTIEEAYNALSTLIPSMFPGSSGGVFTTNPSNNLVEAVSTWGTESLIQTAITPHECWGLRRGRSHWVENTQTGLCCHHLPRNSSIIESFCVPMSAQGETIGLLHLCFSQGGLLGEAKQQLAMAVSEQIALALANLKLRETLQHQSIRDPLTGLFNRRYMEEFLTREISRAQRQEQKIGMIVLDVDHFKRFNDTFGHEAGDVVLREVGILLRANVRNSDIACRYGGEEMVLILPEASLEDTRQRAEQMREAIKHLNISHRRNSLGPITVSFGVACFPEHGTSGEALLRAADSALYQAKAQGRDRVIMA